MLQLRKVDENEPQYGDGDDHDDHDGDGDDMMPAQYGDGDGRVFYSNYRPGWVTQSYEAEGAVELLYQ